MASELTVQTIRGPLSGDNANKIIIPEGQTLDASNGFVPPAGSVLQVETANGSYFTYTSAAAFVEVMSATITTKYDNSLIVISGVVPFYVNSNSASWSGSAYIQLQKDGSTIAGFEHPGPKNDVDEFSASNAIHYTEVVASAGTHTYTVQIKPTIAGGTFEIGRTTYGADSLSRMSIMEIKQ